MDLLTFIATVIGAIAWPITAVIIFLLLRKPLIHLLTLVQHLRFQGIELDFSQQIQALALEARGQLPPIDGKAKTIETLHRDWASLAPLSPRAVVLEAWVMVERAAIEAARRHKLDLRSVELRQPLVLGQALEENGILGENTPMIYHQLRNLRNAAAHAVEFAFTPESAIEYADLAARLTEYLDKA